MKSLISLFLVVGMTLWLSEKASSQGIYTWTNEDGVVCYSNVAPPEDEEDVGIIPETERNEAIEVEEKPIVTETKEGGETVAAKPADEEEAAPSGLEKKTPAKSPADMARAKEENQLKEMTPEELEEFTKDAAVKPKPMREKYLKKRIESTKASIAALEKEQRKRPDDPAVKRALDLNRGYLRKYMKASVEGKY